MAGQIVQRLEEGLVQTVQVTIASTGVAQRVGASIANTLQMKKCQIAHIRTASVSGIYLLWSNSVSSTQYRRLQTAGMEAWEIAASEEAIKNLWISGTAGDILIIELVN